MKTRKPSADGLAGTRVERALHFIPENAEATRNGSANGRELKKDSDGRLFTSITVEVRKKDGSCRNLS
ncbi:MAG TPA: hypothetical protein VNH18_36000, partial [Bryobacteraceae bacterium]|nr:hypothetical protein [Bryobacteraceae bacterium]